jgi:hypothetical protein
MRTDAASLTTTLAETGISIAALSRMTVERYERLAECDLMKDSQIGLINGLLVRWLGCGSSIKERQASAALLIHGWSLSIGHVFLVASLAAGLQVDAVP